MCQIVANKAARSFLPWSAIVVLNTRFLLVSGSIAKVGKADSTANLPVNLQQCQKKRFFLCKVCLTCNFAEALSRGQKESGSIHGIDTS